MNALKLALLAGLVLLAAQISGWRLLDQLFYTLVGLLGLAFVWSRLSWRGLTVHRQTPSERGQVGQPFSERLTLENASWVGKLWVEVHDRSTLPGHHASRVISLGPRRRTQWTVTTQLTRRGRFLLGPLRLRTGDPFGLFPIERLQQGTVELLVYPATVPLTGLTSLAGELPGGQRTQQRIAHPTPSLSGVRDYAPGDSLNRIAWSTTARLGRLMVKEFELDPSADIWLVVDLASWVHVPAGYGQPLAEGAERWRETTEELAVTITASLAQHLLNQGRAVGLMLAGRNFEILPTDRGPRQLGKLLEALAMVRADGEHGLGELLTAEVARFQRRSTLLIITPDPDEGWLPALAGLLPGGPRAAVILIDAATFGGSTSPLLAVGQLAAQGVPTAILGRYDDLPQALGQLDVRPISLAAPRWRRPERW